MKSQLVRIGSICDLINGRAFKPTDWSSEGLPIVRIQNLNNHKAKFNHFNGQVRQRFLIDNGALLFAWSGTPGTSFGAHVWRGGRAVLNQHIFHIVFDESTVNKAYLLFALNQKVTELIRMAHGGVGLQHVTKGVVEDTQIYLPSLNEQRRIVDILSRADGIVRLRREAQQKAAELIPTIFIDMFGDPATNPRCWRVARLGELLSSIDSGHSPKCSDRHRGADEWGVLRLGAVSRCEYDEDEHKTLPCDIAPDSSIEVRSGDLLLSRKNTSELVGASAYVWTTGGQILLPDLIFRLRLPDTTPVHPIYLWKLLTTDAKRRALTRLATGSAGSMPNISKERLRTLPVEVPALDLQMKFVERVKEIRSIRQQQQAAIEKAEAIFGALLAATFSGA